MNLRKNENGKVQFYTYQGDGSVSTYSISSATLPADKWSHVVFTEYYDTTNSRKVRTCYINGVQDSVHYLSDETGIRNTNYSLAIGRYDATHNRKFNGDIDEVRIFDRGLSSDLVLALFASEGGFPSCGQDYADSDFNHDCKTDAADFELFVAQWLDCTDLTGVNCGN